MRSVRRVLLSVAVSAALASSIGGAHAAPTSPEAGAQGDREPEDDPEALISRGIELREQGKDDEALALFQRALARAPSPRARAQVALAEQALGLWSPAERDLAAALAAEADPWIEKNRAALEGALAVVRRHLGTLEVRGTEGAEVLLDGKRLGVLPARPFRVEAGRRTLALRADGFHPSTRQVEIPAGGVARETVTLLPLATAEGARAPATQRPAAPIDEPSGAGRGQRVLGWALAGTGVALGATGAVGLLVRKGIVDDYNGRCPGLGVAQPADCDDQVSSARTWLTVSIVSFVAGGIFAAGGLALVATAPSGTTRDDASRPRSDVQVACAPSLLRGGGALGCAATF